MMTGETPLTPPSIERLAQSYALLIMHDEMTLKSVRDIPPGMYARVEFLANSEKK
jgi:hypothetical protein